MSDYTPSSERVRRLYAYGSVVEPSLPVTADEEMQREAFDRWLEEHDRAVASGAWEEGWTKGAESERTSFGRKVSYAPKRNPYDDDSD